MPSPIRKPLPAAPVWLSPNIWEQIESTGSDTFLVAYSHGLRIERWGETLRMVSPVPPSDSLRSSLLNPPAPRAWKPTRVLFHLEGTPTAEFLLGSGYSGEARELGLTYGIDLTPGIAPGLFPDQRDNRIRLRSLRPKKLLNLFAHTCAFGAIAAADGAETLNIDSSARSLQRGKENYERNQLSGPRHRFWTEDVRRILPRLARRGEKFDAVILDPPTFAHGGRGRAFRIQRELEPMLLACLPLLAPRASLLLSVNEANTTPASLETWARETLHREGVSARLEHGQKPADVPSDRMPATLWIFPED